ncbi:acetylxylan esterase [Algoriphagus sp. CAU 1675]|uniref:glucuronyl esterase domain-containing protein n=1 Tax=Algoriphagus sp. CAU 1675 TaxID=3032597 RepID=UPI0023DB4CD7|nr:acetylxylan esterase [Algoriphagus sp. CAU 1675]MDF2157497.1 acetylxylan esterase [Algoriphagus sp. CAU 1675]
MKKNILFLIFNLGLSSWVLAQQDFNYDESKVPDLVVPDLFVSYKGEIIQSVQDWEGVRRPEVLSMFANQMYGQLPVDYNRMEFQEEIPAENLYEKYGDYKIVQIKVYRNGGVQTIPLHIFTPKENQGPFPVFLLISHRKVDRLIEDVEDQFFDIRQILSKGYAAAVFDVEYVSPDDKERFADGILKNLYPEQMQMENGMRGLSAWAWGAMRAMDYFEQDPLIDPTKAAVVGHSRGGKASLWCGANDPRWAITISNESGCGGAAISRRKFGETVERINTAFPYWFTDNFNEYNGKEETLPFDQHQLIASLAPRAVYVASAMEDLWADPKGEYLSLQLASRTYGEIYGTQLDLPEGYEFEPHVHQVGPVGYHLREGKHNLISEDWEKFLEFARLQFGK